MTLACNHCAFMSMLQVAAFIRFDVVKLPLTHI